MRRRAVMAGVISAAAGAAPRRALAQAVVAVRRVGVLAPDASDLQGPLWEAFVDELARRGHVEGRTLVLERRFGQGDDPALVERLAAELVALKVDVIYAARGSMSALAAKKATASIPVVFYSSGDPVNLGLVASLGRPGGNLTGNSVQGFDTLSKGLQLLAEAVGKLSAIACMLPRGARAQPWFATLDRVLGQAAKALGARFEFVEVASIIDMPAIVKRLARERFDAAMVSDFPPFRPHMARIAALFAEHRLPTFGSAFDGFLLHYGEPRLLLARMAAGYVDKILAGAKPADLPVEQISTFEFVINLKTARALGLTIPQSLLLRADEVIR